MVNQTNTMKPLIPNKGHALNSGQNVWSQI